MIVNVVIVVAGALVLVGSVFLSLYQSHARRVQVLAPLDRDSWLNNDRRNWR